MVVAEFEGSSYNIFSEETFVNNRFDMTDERNPHTISNYVSQHFGITIGETWTCLTCNFKKNSNY